MTATVRAPAGRERWAQIGVGLVVTATLARLLPGATHWLGAACAGLAVFALAVWPLVSPQARLFAWLSCAACVFVALAHAQPAEALADALAQCAQFATLLAALATIRLPMRRSPLIGRAAAALLAASPRRRYATVLFGSHWLSLMFSFGVVSLMGEMLRRRGMDVRHDADARAMMLAVIRGLAFTTAWSPMAISYAIVSTALPSLGVLSFVAIGILLAAIILAWDAWCHRPTTAGGVADPRPPADRGDVRALWTILALSALLFAVTLAVHRVTGWSFMTAASLCIPGLSLAWLAAEARQSRPSPAWRAEAQAFFAVLTETRSEVFIFSASTVIGLGILTAVHAAGLASALGALPPWAWPLLCVWSIPIIAAASVPPTIAVLVWAQFFAQTPSALAAPLTHAMALTLGWSLAIGVSPVSATLLITGSITGIEPRDIARHWNRSFVLSGAVMATAMLAGLYGLGI